MLRSLWPPRGEHTVKHNAHAVAASEANEAAHLLPISRVRVRPQVVEDLLGGRPPVREPHHRDELAQPLFDGRIHGGSAMQVQQGVCVLVCDDMTEPRGSQPGPNLDLGGSGSRRSVECLQAVSLLRPRHTRHQRQGDVRESDVEIPKVCEHVGGAGSSVVVGHDDLLLFVAHQCQVGGAAVNTPGMRRAEGITR